MRLDVFTLFPEHFDWFLRQRHVSNALASGNEMRFHNYRDTTPLSAGQVDDAPYGGGAGMVMRVDVVDAALEAAYGAERDRVRKIALAPAGRLFDEGLAAGVSGVPREAAAALRSSFGIPEDVDVVALVTVGTPAPDPGWSAVTSRRTQPRRMEDEVVRWEQW